MKLHISKYRFFAKPFSLAAINCMRHFFWLLLGGFFLGSVFAQSPVVEIYLIKEKAALDTSEGPDAFHVLKSDLPKEPFIKNGGILFYNDSTFEITVTQAAAEIISTLKPALQVGIPFVLTIDREPILYGYFTNLFSSFTSGANSISVTKSTVHRIQKGIPEYNFEKSIMEHRNDWRLIQAMKISGRLK